jgi:hypothetical protein
VSLRVRADLVLKQMAVAGKKLFAGLAMHAAGCVANAELERLDGDLGETFAWNSGGKREKGKRTKNRKGSPKWR